MRRRALLVAALLLVPALLAGCLENRLVGQPSPAFSLRVSDGSRLNESSFEGRFVILDLMATWCLPCRAQVGHLKQIQEAYGDRVAIVSIGADPTETPGQLEAFALERGLEWPHGLDETGAIGRAFGMRIIPTLVILDPEGTVVFWRQGEVYPAAIARVIDPQGAPPPEPFSPLALALAAFGVGFLAPFNPYRRFHRDARAPLAGLLAGGVFIVLSLLAWTFSGLVSSRASYGALLGGAASLAAVAWWLRARRKQPREPAPPRLALEAGDRLYEALPHFALALTFALPSLSPLGFLAPPFGFVAGLLAAAFIRSRVQAPWDERLGLGGLALAGTGLLAFGLRFVLAP